jgi:hypothetical protein
MMGYQFVMLFANAARAQEDARLQAEQRHGELATDQPRQADRTTDDSYARTPTSDPSAPMARQTPQSSPF